MRSVGYVQDFLGTLAAGLIGGISPGFRVPQGGDTVKREDGGVIRSVRSANLIEISAVTKPAYPAAQIEARNWQPIGEVAQTVCDRRAAYRWRK
jgi:HK97 family phage prohead protease